MNNATLRTDIGLTNVPSDAERGPAAGKPRLNRCLLQVKNENVYLFKTPIHMKLVKSVH